MVRLYLICCECIATIHIDVIQVGLCGLQFKNSSIHFSNFLFTFSENSADWGDLRVKVTPHIDSFCMYNVTTMSFQSRRVIYVQLNQSRLRACAPTERGYCTESRGSYCGRHTSGSSSQLSAVVYQTGSGRLRRLWWSGTECSSGSRCTVHSNAADRSWCCSSLGAQAEWAPGMCRWQCTGLSAPTVNTHTQDSDEKNNTKDTLGYVLLLWQSEYTVPTILFIDRWQTILHTVHRQEPP